MKDVVKKINNKKDKLGQMSWVVPACFGFSCFLTVSSIVLMAIRGFEGMLTQWLFSIGADIFCMAI